MAAPLTTSIAPSMPHRCAEWVVDPKPICTAVAAAIGQTEQKPTGLLPPLVGLVVSYLKVGSVFGAKEWEIFCGRVGPAPALPLNIEDILLSQCHAFPGNKVYETHVLIYIPVAVDEKPLTLKSFGEIAKRYFPENKGYFPENKDGYYFFSTHVEASLGNMPIERPYWVLMTDVLLESRCKTYAAQRNLVAGLAKKALATYEIPKTLEAAVCILTQRVSSHDTSKTRLFSDKSRTYTRCQEDLEECPLFVGSSATGLYVCLGNDSVSSTIGVAPLIRFFEIKKSVTIRVCN